MYSPGPVKTAISCGLRSCLGQIHVLWTSLGLVRCWVGYGTSATHLSRYNATIREVVLAKVRERRRDE